MSHPKVNAVDLFCGAGGLTHGLQKAGINVVAGYDVEESCRFAYEHNNQAQFINKDVSTLTKEEIEDHFGEAEYTLLAGCAPCQPFSTYSRTTNTTGTKDKRWSLLRSFSRLVTEVKPDFVTMENVPGLLTQSIFDEFKEELYGAGYQFDYKVVFCPDYGMAQTRKRLMLVAALEREVLLPLPTHTPDSYLTVKDVISDLPALRAGGRLESDPLHRTSILSEINLKRIQSSKQGGSWLDWPEELRAACHQKDSGKTFPSVYGRMSWDKPSPTITTQCNGYGNGRFGHPEQDRAISLREAALLQSFPKSYQFASQNENRSIGSLAKMIGNAVPVALGEIVGNSITRAIA
ncbi:DNA cytosine methyltransferase [Vibrio splendidus]|uniref:DNA (cytosine-5-)-methyltransferase n=1 Tax=Vibrio splendidus TaxID=29497 RepID=A0ABD5AF28_VIBSP|nr:DNA cytosine methyltransferase [Vibrio splendidus]MDP2491841.1 DNA cytosine methyltransferase [Vibrio splendidus]PMO55269.1 DNA (cytosine-5-)-methyltransferase [Vibrio splendidus]